jgi:uncharacterized protein YkwD
MRRHLALVCAVTAAVLLVGGIAATTAGADTTPEVPGLPAVDMPDLPAIPQLPADAVPDREDPDAPARAAQPVSQHDSDRTQQDVPHRPGDATPSTSNDRKPAVPNKAAGNGRGPAADPDRGNSAGSSTAGPAALPATATVAAAKRDVSPASVSTNPSAPIQQQVLSLVNQNRRRGGCGDLSLDRRLIRAAYEHAADMARRGYFAHESPNGDRAGDRVEEAGYHWQRYGENIARGQDSAYEVVDGWMHSPEHRENILDCQLHQMGIGLAFAPDRTPYWVQDFATPR